MTLTMAVLFTPSTAAPARPVAAAVHVAVHQPHRRQRPDVDWSNKCATPCGADLVCLPTGTDECRPMPAGEPASCFSCASPRGGGGGGGGGGASCELPDFAGLGLRDDAVPASAVVAGQTNRIQLVDPQGLERWAKLRIPAGCGGGEARTGADAGCPMVVMLHGAMDACSMPTPMPPEDGHDSTIDGLLPEFGEEVIFAVLAGHSGGGSLDGEVSIYGFNWAGHPSSTRLTDADDRWFVEQVIGAVASQAALDIDRVYGWGHSNGAIYSNWLAVNTDWLAAISPTAGSFVEGIFEPPATPADARATGFVGMQGLLDTNVPVAGGGNPAEQLYPTADLVAFWAAAAGCDAAADVSAIEIDGEQGELWEYPGCDAGVRVAMYLWSELGHNLRGVAGKMDAVRMRALLAMRRPTGPGSDASTAGPSASPTTSPTGAARPTTEPPTTSPTAGPTTEQPSTGPCASRGGSILKRGSRTVACCACAGGGGRA